MKSYEERDLHVPCRSALNADSAKTCVSAQGFPIIVLKAKTQIIQKIKISINNQQKDYQTIDSIHKVIRHRKTFINSNNIT